MRNPLKDTLFLFRYLRFLLRVLWHTHRLATRNDPKSAAWLCSAVEHAYWKREGAAPWTLLRLRDALWDAQATFHSTHVLDESSHISKESTHASDSHPRPE